MEPQTVADEAQSGSRMNDDAVNHQILDAIRQAALKLVNDSGAQSLAMIHAVATETTGMLMHNAVGAQRQMQMLGAAAVTATCAKLLGLRYASPTPPPSPPPPPPLKPEELINPFQSGTRLPTIPLMFPTPLPSGTPSQPSADLQGLSIVPEIGLSPSFSASVTDYSAAVPNSTATITLTPIAAESSSAIQVGVNGGPFADVNSGSATSPLPLNASPSPNIIKLVVTTSDQRATKTYTLAITRAAS
ncbi:MAG: RebB family R body protein [Verrucomicrobia bacterium]|nr:RebB family R body protein [Verrucomicrobiota bacterium]